MAAPDYFSRKPSYVRSRSGLASAAAPTTPGSPHTPLLNRSISSQFASPGSYRAEEENLVYEIGARSFRAGFAGESTPRCTLGFGPEESRRVDDFRPWTADGTSQPRSNTTPWGSDYELWSLDVRTFDVGLVEDKFERAVREAQTKYLMLETRQRKAVLALPSGLPHPLLDIALSTIFTTAQPASVVLWNAPLLNTVAAGLRSALVIDIGWHETTVSGIYEFREVLHRRSVRAAKMLTREMARTLQHDSNNATEKVSFDTAEDIVTRLAWCRTSSDAAAQSENPPVDRLVSIPVNTDTSISQRQVAFDKLAQPTERTFFGSSAASDKMDDHELPLHLLAYRCLLALPLDVRAICMSRIVVIGGVSVLPGLKQRLVGEVEKLVATKVWDPVMNYGSVAEKRKNGFQSIGLPVREKPPDAPENGLPADETPHLRAADAPHDKDDISEKMSREAAKRGTVVQGVVRGVETLGAWAGASMIASLKVEGVLEIKRDDFMKNGLASLGNTV